MPTLTFRAYAHQKVEEELGFLEACEITEAVNLVTGINDVINAPFFKQGRNNTLTHRKAEALRLRL